MSTELSENDLQQILSFTVTLARKAGALILEGSEAIQSAPAKDINEKKNSVDLVTEYDVRVEELVKKELGEKYPEFKFIGEESYAAGARPELTDVPTFCVDPIDGTTNFVHGFPFVCISLGLIYKQRPVLGVIYNPFLDHLYTGIKGQGSYLTRNSKTPVKLPLAVPKPLPSLSQALIAVEWGSDRTKKAIDGKGNSFKRLAVDGAEIVGGKMAHSLRSIGSAALNFAMVAQGGLDLYWEIGCWEWDVCAGIVIAEEAGGIVTGSVDKSKLAKDGAFDVTPDVLTGRKYLVVRAIRGEEGEADLDAQKRIVEEFYECVADIDID
ncbi:inositol monophosphatase [Athelia psychrophila]|uniref:Inositol-1-monophosphatase n=1 Tax=Athelia psychrophila TaxID=1759441 RepID=A0A166EE13_9AGAM|nr:inositol monophosphatase [Fibularhizoctonia sp. CBS 109695]